MAEVIKSGIILLTQSEFVTILENIFGKTSDVSLIDFKLDCASDKSGCLGEYFRLVLNVKEKNNKSEERLELFIKSLPVTDAINRDMVNNTGVFPKETSLYTKLFPELDKYGPSNWHGKCYYARPNILVMENLNEQGYRNLYETEEFNETHLKSALKCLAQMHASSLIYEVTTGTNLQEKFGAYLHEIAVVPENGWFRAGLNLIEAIALIHPKFKDNVEIQSKQLLPKFNSIYEIIACTQFRNVFCHRDIWDKNILFKFNGTTPVDCTFVDFQHCRYSPPALDVLLLIYLNCKRTLRKQCFDDSLKLYYTYLADETNSKNLRLDEIITWEEFERSCNYALLLPLTLNGIYAPVTSSPDEFLNKLQIEDPEEYNQYMIVDRTKITLDLMESDEIYRDKMFEVVEDILDYFYNT